MRSSPSPSTSTTAASLALKFTAGDTAEYLRDRTIDGYLVDRQETHSPFHITEEQVLTQTVIGTGKDGSALIAPGIATWEEVNGDRPQLNGPDVIPTNLTMGTDGTITNGGSLPFPSQGVLIAGAPGIDWFVPTLPNGSVSPGDTWTRDFQRTYPLRGGVIDYHTTSTYVSDTTLNGISTAQVRTQGTAHFDVSVRLADLIPLDPARLSSLSQSAAGLLYSIRGDVTFVTVGLVDAAGGRVMQTQSVAQFQLLWTLSDPGSEQAPSTLSYTAHLSEQATRVDVKTVQPPPLPSGGPSPSASPSPSAAPSASPTG